MNDDILDQRVMMFDRTQSSWLELPLATALRRFYKDMDEAQRRDVLIQKPGRENAEMGAAEMQEYYERLTA